VVERFHRLLTEELLRDVQPVTDRHLNRLLAGFRGFYSNSVTHANEAEPPLLPDVTNKPALNAPRLLQNTKKTGAPERAGRPEFQRPIGGVGFK
jgi:hypothetical protein